MITTIEVYTIAIRRKRAHHPISFAEEPDIFQMLTDKEHGLLQYIDKNLTGNLPSEKMTVSIPHGSNSCSRAERFICGLIETGHYGKILKAVDKDNPKDGNKQIILGKDKSIMKPFFFFLKIPNEGSKALLILERTDGDGIYPVMSSILVSYLNIYLAAALGEEDGKKIEFCLDKRNFILGSYVKKLKDAIPRSYTITANSLSKDKADQYFGELNTTDISVDLVIRFGNSMDKATAKLIQDKIKSGNTFFDSPDLSDIFEDSSKKYTSTLGEGKAAKTRTVYLDEKKENPIRPYYEIEVDENEKGFSDYESIKGIVRKFVYETPDFKALF